MQFSLSPFSIVVLLAIFLAFTIVVIAWRFRHSTSESWPLAILMLFVAEWLISYYLELASLSLNTSITMAKFQYIGITFCPTLLLVFAFTYYKRRFPFKRIHLLLLAIVPAVTLILAFTNEAHHLIWTQYTTTHQGAITLSYPSYGSWFWFYGTYSYILLLIASYHLLRRSLSTASQYRWQSIAVLLAVLAPWISNMLYGLNVISGIDPTPISFSFSGLMLWVGIFRFHLLNVLPAARAMIIDSMKDGILVIDTDNRIIDCNFAAAQILDLDARALLSKKLDQLIANRPELRGIGIDTSSESSRIEVMKNGKSYHYGSEGSRIEVIRNGKSYHCDVVSSPIRSGAGGELGRVLSLHDITERIDMLVELHDSWAKELEAKSALEQDIAARSLFVNVLAHELKTPLTPQIAAIELLRDTYVKDKESNDYRLINLAANGAKALNDTLSDLLDLATFNKGSVKLVKKPMSIGDTINEVADQFNIMAGQVDQSITVEIPEHLPALRADAGRIKQVLVNLVSNAIKFNAAGSEVAIRAKRERSELIVEVEDHGVGITPEQQERIFKPYHRTEQDRQLFHGLGLGLAIAKEVIDAHKGKIWVDSEPKQGSTFCFSLPL
ncbi:histidine kinase N-terminal 7TM domain-containing protein [Chloroflexota bacterium]